MSGPACTGISRQHTHIDLPTYLQVARAAGARQRRRPLGRHHALQQFQRVPPTRHCNLLSNELLSDVHGPESSWFSQSSEQETCFACAARPPFGSLPPATLSTARQM